MKRPSNNTPDALFRAAQDRVEELTQALQGVYTWAYASGSLDRLDEILASACVPIPAGALTRSRMIQVWEEGCEKFPRERAEGPTSDPASVILWMLHYTSRLRDAQFVDRSTVRIGLWKLANVASKLLSEDFDVLGRALEEYSRAAKKHPGMTLECDGHTDATRLFALVEEIGEVAACLTYDNNSETGHGSDLESEVIQVIALALAWATRYLEDGEAGRGPNRARPHHRSLCLSPAGQESGGR